MVKKSLKITIFYRSKFGVKKKEIAKKKDTAPNVRSKGAWVLGGRDALH
jgi:hypothetical protein